MKKNSLLLFLLSLFFVAPSYAKFQSTANTVSVRILTTKIINTFIFSPLGCTYAVYGDGVLLEDCDPSGIFQMSIEKNFIRLKTFEKNIGKFSVIKMVAK